jgi:2,3-bisphosphoglycerate-independent phosphoglycerate mutase
MTRPVCLIVRDGYGYNPNPKANAIVAANTPNNDLYAAEYPKTILDCCGPPVGLPEGFQGSSEVGHMNMGAGRVVVQEVTLIYNLLEGETLNAQAGWTNLVSAWKANGSRLHLFGLLQDEGVHAHQEHLFKLMRQARAANPEGQIVVHPFLDGRDTPPRSCFEYVGKLQGVMDEVGNCRVGTAMGRYYAMDRSETWELTDKAFNAIVDADGRQVEDLVGGIQTSYDNDKMPDGSPMGDEYIPPLVVGNYTGVQDGDVVIHTNYRQDRAMQLTKAFVEDAYPGQRPRRPQVTYLGLTRYYDEFENYLLPLDFEGATDMSNLLGETLAKAGLNQLRIAEKQKYPHVTSFFNGKSTTPNENEDWVNGGGRFDPATFAQHPEMEANIVADQLLETLKADPQKYGFILVNFANCDMVGHTGDLDAAIKAVEVVDECLGQVVETMLGWDFQVLITADHGNADQMIDYDSGKPRTAHSLNPVECIYVANDSEGKEMLERGKLSDLAVTVLELLGIDKPAEMTAESLLKE